jgi:O-antigen biosynthesis protein
LAKGCEIKTIQTVDIPSDLVEADAAVATLWVTAYALLRLKDTTPRFYFVQDYEPLFYPAGTTYGLAEATYRFGFHGVCNTYPLRELYEQHGGRADHFVPAVDTSVFHCRGRAKHNSTEPFLLFNYARPGHPRNCFEVVAEGLIELKRRMKDRLRIITAGAEWDPKNHGLSGIVEHMGLLSYKETGKLYRSVDAGIVAMATCHPSYLPFELMACGALVATNRNRHTIWLLKDQENCVLFDLTRSAIADTVESALEDPVRLEKITRRATRTIAENHGDWDQACEDISSAILRERDAGIRANSSR